MEASKSVIHHPNYDEGIKYTYSTKHGRVELDAYPELLLVHVIPEGTETTKGSLHALRELLWDAGMGIVRRYDYDVVMIATREGESFVDFFTKGFAQKPEEGSRIQDMNVYYVRREDIE